MVYNCIWICFNILSYSYVEPYRAFLQENTSISSIDEFSKGISYAISNFGRSTKIDDNSTLNNVISRFGYLNEFTRMVNYKMINQNDLFTPDFRLRFWQAPLITLIPRFIWHDKPISDLGMTFITWRVQGNSTVMSSSAFGPIGSLYFAGAFYVILGFIFYAFIIKFVSKCLTLNKVGYLIIGLAAFYSFFGLESEFSFIFATIFQTIVLAFIGQLLLFNK
jgi:hypothetical protein